MRKMTRHDSRFSARVPLNHSFRHRRRSRTQSSRHLAPRRPSRRPPVVSGLTCQQRDVGDRYLPETMGRGRVSRLRQRRLDGSSWSTAGRRTSQPANAARTRSTRTTATALHGRHEGPGQCRRRHGLPSGTTTTTATRHPRDRARSAPPVQNSPGNGTFTDITEKSGSRRAAGRPAVWLTTTNDASICFCAASSGSR